MAVNHIRFFTSAALLLALASCKPNDDVQPIDTILETAVPPLQMPISNNVYGALYSIKVNKVVQGKEVNSEIASAVFYNEPSNTATATEGTSAGYVQINNFNLNQNTNNGGYDRTATDGHIFNSLGFDDGLKWYIGGQDGIPEMEFQWSGSFPYYTGSFPASISKANGLNLTFDANTLDYTDSVFVAIAAGDKMIVKRYRSDAGTVTIPASDLGQLQNCPYDKPGYIQISTASISPFLMETGDAAVSVKQHIYIRPVVIY